MDSIVINLVFRVTAPNRDVGPGICPGKPGFQTNIWNNIY